jgi:hypothetical protein
VNFIRVTQDRGGKLFFRLTDERTPRNSEENIRKRLEIDEKDWQIIRHMLDSFGGISYTRGSKNHEMRVLP